MGAFFTAGMYVAGALGCLSLIIMFFFSDKPLWNQMSAIAWRGSTDFILVAVAAVHPDGRINETAPAWANGCMRSSPAGYGSCLAG